MGSLDRMTTIGERIRKLRIKSGKTQAKLGEELFVTGNTIDKWEHSSSKPSLELVGKIAELFDVSCDELITGTGTENKTLVKELGLSNESIETLKRINKEGGSFEAFAINLLLSPQYIGLLKSIFKYLNTDYMSPMPISTNAKEEFPIEFVLAFPPIKHLDGQSVEFYEVKERDIYDKAALYSLLMDFMETKKKAYETSTNKKVERKNEK